MARIIKDDRGVLHGAVFGFAGMTDLIDATSIPVDSGQCVDIVNCDLDDEHNASRRAGYTKVSATVATSFSGQYCVSGGYLCSFDGATVTPLTTAFSVLATCEFKAVNDVTVFSDNEKIGIINGATVTRIDTAANWVDVATLETWITDHYPADPAEWNGVDSNSNFAVDAFKLATMAGKCLEFFDGALYLAIDNFIYRTTTFNVAKMDIRYNVVAGFPHTVTMIAKTKGGLFVGTEGGLYFLPGTGLWIDGSGTKQGGFKQVDIAATPVYYRSLVFIEGEQAQLVKNDSQVAIFTTSKGIMAGLPGGNVVNLSQNKIDLPYAGQSVASVFRAPHYIISFSGGRTVVLNANTGTHSRYTNTVFESLFMYAGVCYGAKAAGIYSLTGATDDGTLINAYITTPAPDFGSRKRKTALIIYLQGRCSGEMLVNVYSNEGDASEDLTIEFDDDAGMHRRRTKGPKGIKGTNLQFKVSNVDGLDFTISSLEATLLELQRTS